MLRTHAHNKRVALACASGLYIGKNVGSYLFPSFPFLGRCFGIHKHYAPPYTHQFICLYQNWVYSLSELYLLVLCVQLRFNLICLFLYILFFWFNSSLLHSCCCVALSLSMLSDLLFRCCFHSLPFKWLLFALASCVLLYFAEQTIAPYKMLHKLIVWLRIAIFVFFMLNTRTRNKHTHITFSDNLCILAILFIHKMLLMCARRMIAKA